MTEHLRAARNELEAAAGSADDDVGASLEEVANAFAEFERGDPTPDHAVVDSHLNELRQLRERTDGRTAEHVGEALEHAESYREDIPQA